jgi:hypothetical protein
MRFWKYAILPGLVLISFVSAQAQNDWIDTILPANHLLEKLPPITVDGAEETGGLFEFIDLNGDGRKDLLLAYRAQAEAAELAKPHDQTLAVCFYDPKGGHYVKLFEETGPTLKAIHVITQNPGQKKFLFVERDGGNNVSIHRGFVVLQGKIPQLYDIKTPPLYLKTETVSDQLEVLVSSKQSPSNEKSAEKVFIWNDTKEQFLSKSGEVLSEKVLQPTATFTFTFTDTSTPTKTSTPTATFTFTKTSTPEPTPTSTPIPIVKKPKPTHAPKGKLKHEKAPERVVVKPSATEVEKPQPPAEVPESAIQAPTTVASGPVPTKLKWWREPFEPTAAYQQLRNSLVPARIKANNLSLLGQQAKGFFDALRAKGVDRQRFSDYRAGYYTAVARALKENGRIQEAKNYVGMVLKGRPDFQEAVKLQAELK